MIKPHENAQYVSCDQMAECYDGVSSELYQRLWEALQNAEETVPAENCGSSYEYRECNKTRVADHWDFFTEDERVQINAVIEANRW
mgnify:CR=1 FL=1